MISINELKGFNLKKDLKLKRVIKRWHNKNKSGGNFGINLKCHEEPHYEITGYHDLEGNIYNLSVGELYQCGTTVFKRDSCMKWDYKRLVTLLNKLLNKTEETKLFTTEE